MTESGVAAERPIRVLVVEDSRTQAQQTREVLEEGGYLVEVARDGAAGLAAAQAGRFDVVVSDIVMPAMDGFEFCRRFKATAVGQQTMVILYTSLSEPLDIIRGLESGADSFLTKPSPPPRLRSRIERLLASRRLRAAGGGRDRDIEVAFLGQRFTITAEREQILCLLLSTFEDAVTASDRLRARERDLADAHRALEQHARAVEEASRAKSEFLANMSHELRTPLNAILGFTELLREQLGPAIGERHVRYLGNVRDAGEHLLELINDVLDISKVEAGRIELRLDGMGLDQLIEPVVQGARQEADRRRIHFSATVPADARVRVDPARMRQVLFNLVSNALKFTLPGGEVALMVVIEGRDLRLSVCDTGIGIPADRQDRVFGMFERVNEDRSDALGTGLGLALTKRLVELHGGQIDFESVVGEGTTFRVRLPWVVLEAISGPRLLVVDDDARDADLIVELARAAGLIAEVVGTAQTALAALDPPPVGVVLDLRLPDMRGERVLERMRATGVRQIPLVIVSVEDDDGRARRLGADDYFTKPIERARFAAWLAGLAQGAREEPDAPAAG